MREYSCLPLIQGAELENMPKYLLYGAYFLLIQAQTTFCEQGLNKDSTLVKHQKAVL